MNKKKKVKHHARVKKVKILAAKEIAPDLHLVDLQLEVASEIPPPLPAEIEIGDKPLAEQHRTWLDWFKGIW